MPRPILPFLLTLFLSCILSQSASAALAQGTEQIEIPEVPIPVDRAFVGKLGDTLVVAGGVSESGETSDIVYTLSQGADQWEVAGNLQGALSDGGAATSGSKLYLVGGLLDGAPTDKVSSLELTAEGVQITDLAPLPVTLVKTAAAVNGSNLLVAGGSSDGSPAGSVKRFLELDINDANSQWIDREVWEGPALHDAFLVKSVTKMHLIGGITPNGTPAQTVSSYHPRDKWASYESEFPAGQIVSSVKLGDSHAATLVVDENNVSSAYLHHMVGNTWVQLSPDLLELSGDAKLVSDGRDLSVLSHDLSTAVDFGIPQTSYGWLDNISITLYFIVVLYVGFHFSKQGSSSEDYFRGGHKIPWWATGMSLFATGASAQSLMSMPGVSYAGDWTLFAISIYSIMALPISMFFFAPVIRKLNFGTAFEYLEERFGLSVRLIGSIIFVFYQILGRMGTVLLLPSIALEAIVGIPMEVSVPIMGLVTIAYTFLGGLSAVIWTDTIQGFVMVAAVAGCLLMVYLKVDVPFSEMWTTLESSDKLHVFDWGFSLTNENVFTVFIGIIAVTLLGIGDQNFVQRVQCSPTLKTTQKAIATQMAVAVPINILLFALGTALFLFYQQSPTELNPVMRNDGIYPYFAAQQLPPGVSGLVIAAILAATMSTISSGICSVSNLAVDDFYKRFSKSPTDKAAVNVGRICTVIVGLFGIASAFYLNSFDTPSVWELALRVISIVTATTVGIYALALFSERANEIGVLAGIACGMATTYIISTEGLIVFWLYPVVGSFVTYFVGLAVSLATGGNKKNIDGLTLATLKNRTGGLDD